MNGHTPPREIRNEVQLRLPESLRSHVDPSSLSFAPPGWTNELEQMHLRLAAIEPQYRLAEVKEKFGRLRVYLPGKPRMDAALNGVIEEYERRSAQVCQECGAPGCSRAEPGRRIATLCDSCHGVVETDANS